MPALFYTLASMAGLAGGYLIYNGPQIGVGLSLVVLAGLLIATAYISRYVATLYGR